ncbi:hypothetical protein JW935_07935 [candidate division KSB1 bacterium]|nr:hypothetical protein [candidate division KSB1 bacterium]
MSFKPDNKKKTIQLSLKLQIIRDLLQGKEVEAIMDEMSKQEMLDTKEFVFEKILEFGFKTKGRKFSRDRVLNTLNDLKNYQKEKSCNFPAGSCRNIDCYDRNPDCARQKMKMEIAILSRFFHEHINLTKI